MNKAITLTEEERKVLWLGDTWEANIVVKNIQIGCEYFSLKDLRKLTEMIK